MKIVRAEMARVHERGLRIDHAVGSKYAQRLIDAAERVGHVFEYGLEYHSIKRRVKERQVMAVSGNINAPSYEYVGRYNDYVVRAKQTIHPGTTIAGSHHKHFRPWRARGDAFSQSLHVSFSKPVRCDGWSRVTDELPKRMWVRPFLFLTAVGNRVAVEHRSLVVNQNRNVAGKSIVPRAVVAKTATAADVHIE